MARPLRLRKLRPTESRRGGDDHKKAAIPRFSREMTAMSFLQGNRRLRTPTSGCGGWFSCRSPSKSGFAGPGIY